MPYAKKYFKKRPYTRRRRAGFSNWAASKQLAMSAWKGVQYLKGLVNSEMYHYDQNGTGTMSASGTILPLVAIANGDGDGARTGNSILVKSLNLKVISAVGAINAFVRILLVRDTQQVADTTPAVTDVLESSGVISPLNNLTAGRFDIIYDRRMGLSPYGPANWSFAKFLKMSSHVHYNGTAGTDVQKNGLYLIIITDAGATQPTYAYDCRVAYHDN